jgi:ABC-type dipeptide/oligopeptide/nickel transport system permease component
LQRYVITRVLTAVPTLVSISILVFLLVHLTPVDPARVSAGPNATYEDVEAVRHQLGLDRPLYEQYWVFISKAAVGDFGRSYQTRVPVADEIASKLPFTLELTLVAMLIAIIIGTLTGIVSAVRQYSILDSLATSMAVLGLAMPNFWLGLLLQLGFALGLGLFPASGRGGPLWTPEGLRYIALPAFALGAQAAAAISRLTRSSMLEVLKQDYLTTARAKGLRSLIIIRRHALKNAIVPVLTLISIQFGLLLGGATIQETIFSWPGIGRYVVQAILARDYPAIQGVVMVMAVIFVTISLIVDLAYGYLDPRIRYS